MFGAASIFTFLLILIAPYRAYASLSYQTLRLQAQQSPSLIQSDHDGSNSSDYDGQNDWIWKYFDEQSPHEPNSLLIRESSIDERLANVIYTTNRAKMVNLDHLNFNLGDKKLNRQYERLAAGPKFNEELCGRELGQMLALIDEMEHILGEKRQNLNNSSRKIDERHIRLAQVLDSFGKYETGILLGRTHFLGTYSQCISLRMILNQEKPETKTTARYCIAKLRVDRHLDPALKARQRKSYDMDTVLNVGMCIPGSCHTLSFHKQKHLFKKLIDSQFKLPKSIFIDENLELDSVHCLVDEESYLAKVPVSGKLLIAFIVGWLGLAIYATFRNNNIDTTSKRDQSSTGEATSTWLDHVYNCLDLKRSWEDFADEKRPQAGRVNLNTINPVKVLGCLYVVLGHSVLNRLMANMGTLHAYTVVESNPKVFGIFGGTVIIDTFFVITGILLAYSTMFKLHKKREFSFLEQCFKFFAERYLRLVPMYFLVFWFKKSIFNYLGSGPMWDHGFNKETEAGACRQESWSTPFTFMSAYLPLTAQCLPHAWSIAGDLFFSLILAPIIVLMVKRPKLAVVISVLLCISSNASMRAKVSTIPNSLMAEVQELRIHGLVGTFKEMSTLYTIPHYRIFSVLIGALAGYALYHYNQSVERLKEWPGWFKGPATKISFTFMAILLLSLPIVSSFKPLLATFIYRDMFEHSMTTCRLLWALANAIVLLRMVTDWKDNFWMQNSAGKFWQCMSKLNYCILLIHMDMLFYDLHIRDSLELFSGHRMLIQSSAVYLLCCLFGLILHICFENPLDKLTKGLLNGVDNKKIKSS